MIEGSTDIYGYDETWKDKLISATDGNGNALAENSVGALNAIRYRGYVYDSETGLYYLQSRYYDPVTCRFVNADGQMSGVGNSVKGYNLYAYCFNNPINMSDPFGKWPKWIETAVNWVNEKIVQPIKNLFSKSSKTVAASTNNLPTTGEPGSSKTLPNPDGTPKQKRWYGSDRNAERDRDYNHPGNMPFPHDHEWKNGKRQEEHLPPSPDYKFSLEPIVGVGVVTMCTVGITYVLVNNVTGVGFADDFLLAPLSAGASSGLIMISG